MLAHRYCKLDIQIGNIMKSYESLRVDFDVARSVGGLYDTANITIYGMPLQDIQYLTTDFDYTLKTVKRNAVTLTAGYTVSGVTTKGQIFSGSIVQAAPHVDKADLTVQLQATSGYLRQVSKAVVVATKTATLRQVCADLAAALGLALSFKTQDVNLGAYTFIGSPLQQIEQLRGYNGIDVKIFIADDKLVVQDMTGPAGPAFKLSAKSGLIGSPEPTFMGVYARSFLNPLLFPGGFVNIVSNKLPNTSKTYVLMEVRHVGSRRDIQWHTEFRGQEVGIV